MSSWQRISVDLKDDVRQKSKSEIGWSGRKDEPEDVNELTMVFDIRLLKHSKSKNARLKWDKHRRTWGAGADGKRGLNCGDTWGWILSVLCLQSFYWWSNKSLIYSSAAVRSFIPPSLPSVRKDVCVCYSCSCIVVRTALRTWQWGRFCLSFTSSKGWFKNMLVSGLRLELSLGYVKRL